MLNLDTHILLYALDGGLTPREKRVLAGDRWGISSIVLWEITKLRQKGRIAVGLDSPLLVRALGRLQIWPLSREVCLNLSMLDFAGDPADELIASTSLTYDVPLVTRDRRIRTSKSGETCLMGEVSAWQGAIRCFVASP
jgi:PIN domain nuclease of toxin-antitoxin system